MKTTCKKKRCYIVYKWMISDWVLAGVFETKKLAVKHLKDNGCKYNRQIDFYYKPGTKDQYTMYKAIYYVEK